MINYLKGLLLAALALVAGCEMFSGDDGGTVTTGVYVVNQGDFGTGNGSVTIHNPATGTTSRNAIGDLNSTLQSLFIAGSRGYLAADTGGRIDIIDLRTNTRIDQITGLVNPRYMIMADQGKGYVTNLYGEAGSFSGGTVTVLNLATNEIAGTIDVGDHPEGLAMYGARLFVANSGFGAGTTLTVINTGTDRVSQTIDLPCEGPRTLFIDNDADLFAVCTGRLLFDENWNVTGETPGSVVVLRASSGSIVTSVEFETRLGSDIYGQDAYFVPERNEAYLIAGNSVVRLNVAARTVGETVFTAESGSIGAVAYDAASDLIYVSTVPNFTESGTVHILQRDGTPAGSFEAGIGPSFISFR